MTNTPYEIPNEVREFAERGVEQARKAFEGFVDVAHKTIGAVDAAASTTQSSAKSVGSQVLTYAEQNVNAAFELVHKLVHAKDPQEVMTIQNEFLKSQVVTLQEQAKTIGGLIQKAAIPEKK